MVKIPVLFPVKWGKVWPMLCRTLLRQHRPCSSLLSQGQKVSRASQVSLQNRRPEASPDSHRREIRQPQVKDNNLASRVSPVRAVHQRRAC